MEIHSQENQDDDGKAPVVDLRQKINEKKQKSDGNGTNKQSPSIVDELNDIMDKKHDEDALDFEAEDGECADEREENPAEKKEPEKKEKKDSDGEIEVNHEKNGFSSRI